MTSHPWPGPCDRRHPDPIHTARGHVPEDPVSQQHDDTAPVEHDPTGMRALLASLPEPGPMPDDLVARISAALAVEAQRGDGIDQLWSLDDGTPGRPAARRRRRGDDPDAGAQVVPLRRRIGLRHLGVAAAVVGVLGLGGFLVKSLPGDVMAAFGTAGGLRRLRGGRRGLRRRGGQGKLGPGGARRRVPARSSS